MNEYQNPPLEHQPVVRKPSLHTVSMTELYDMAFPPRTPADGLNGQLEEFLQRHPDTRFIIVDTLQRVREAGNENYTQGGIRRGVSRFYGGI